MDLIFSLFGLMFDILIALFFVGLIIVVCILAFCFLDYLLLPKDTMNEPRTLSEAIDRIRTKLSMLEWTDTVFGRVALISIQKPGQDKPLLLPMLPTSTHDYIDCRPDDNQKSVIFFVAAETEKNDFNRARHSPTHAIRATRPLTLIGWLNLEKLGLPYATDPFSEEIRLELKAALKYVPCVIQIGDVQDGPLATVYRPFQVSDLDRKYDRWPYFAFRIELTVMTIEK